MNDTNLQMWKRAVKVIPGGVNSPVRSFVSVGGTPYFVQRAKGAYVYDLNGRRYIDYVQSYGASILGHADSRVTVAVSRAAELGTTYGAPTEGEVLLAEEVVERVRSVEMVRLVSSGTEATMTALRLARGVTGRNKVVKFDGCYHGHSDQLLASAGSGVASLGLAGSVGVSANAVSDTLVVPYNQVPVLDDETACVIVEPVAANMGLIPPQEGFLSGLRRECDRVGALLIFDEVITGFRVAKGGVSDLFDVDADLYCFGKVMGGGLPIGALAGRSEIMRQLAPTGPVYQAGTLSGNPVATAAGLTVLRALDENSYSMLEGRSKYLAEGLEKVISEAGFDVQIHRFGPLLSIFFGDLTVTDYLSAKKSVALGAYPYFFHAMLQRGVALAPGPYEVMFPSLAHSWDDIELSVDLASAAANQAFTEWSDRKPL
ncbi:glutamate-1-semialdehyde 2,1-aminomutase [Ferrithrix thermotolerans DSM 19514]|uniref:Glutamate-1-semialdehyde 2,1-aminomutase n=1 Tax=Ferrithrix thermotolerans DSM 19514 TaxID=1121881 RepID=A0A1M4SP93_9ACTN|nr:glutamate-1-semialdehyde 2,1-aminomutase [Ferrithrix thermotolerans]SHE34040.1 glutamate-1-semialdehyde 2,1-aminomutase [Ferrithrix thermotolerans DSM 19514]